MKKNVVFCILEELMNKMSASFAKASGDLIKFAYNRFDPSECLFLCCSDEGYIPGIPEVLNEEGFDLPRRTISNPPLLGNLVSTINNALGNSYVQVIIPPSFI